MTNEEIRKKYDFSESDKLEEQWEKEIKRKNKFILLGASTAVIASLVFTSTFSNFNIFSNKPQDASELNILKIKDPKYPYLVEYENGDIVVADKTSKTYLIKAETLEELRLESINEKVENIKHSNTAFSNIPKEDLHLIIKEFNDYNNLSYQEKENMLIDLKEENKDRIEKCKSNLLEYLETTKDSLKNQYIESLKETRENLIIFFICTKEFANSPLNNYEKEEVLTLNITDLHNEFTKKLYDENIINKTTFESANQITLENNSVKNIKNKSTKQSYPEYNK